MAAKTARRRLRRCRTGPQYLRAGYHAGLRNGREISRGHAATPEKETIEYEKPDPDEYFHTRKLLADIPATARTLAQSANSVIPLLLAMLIDDDGTIAATQYREIAARLNEETAREAVAFRNTHIVRLPAQTRLPLTALASPALRKQSRDTLRAFLGTLSALAKIDGDISLFEFCFIATLQSQVREISAPARYAKTAHFGISDVKKEIAVLLAVVAQARSR